MPRRVPFADKLLNRIDRIDRKSIRDYLTDLTQTKSLYEEVLDHLNEGLLVLAPDGRLQYFNRQAALWFDIGARAKGQIPIQEISMDAPLLHFITQNLAGIRERKVGDFSVLAPLEIHLRVFLTPLESSPEGKILVVLLNVTADKAASIDHNRLRRIESLIALTSAIAHEIGNPLNSLGIHLQLLKQQIQNLPRTKKKTFEKTIDVIQSETDRLDSIIRNFLKATRKPPLRFKTEDLNRIVQDAIEFMRPELEKDRIQVSFRQDQTLPFFLLDRERLYQAFINLIKNAREAMPKGGSLSVSTAHKAKLVILAFRDRGVGIQDADLPHIFEPYFTTKQEGSGLGLMTVLDSVSEHGGRIEVSSKAGKGTTFTLLLPIRQPKLQLPQYKTR